LQVGTVMGESSSEHAETASMTATLGTSRLSDLMGRVSTR
jgi:hypothetical protein